ncbi:MAG: GNAT family N-acetyltransferase [Oscillospiraceae bacterium]|jgi:ribosomal protein S18 acetylase RimI-like enzyme|nr:GNAT family N-acetyltransferase [Oscillospiraceae bacterium]
MKDKVLLYEELSLNAHPALQTQLYDGWLLRFANGYTNRANSISPLYPSSLDLHEKITECESRYFSLKLPAVYKLTDHSDLGLDKVLDDLGYAIVTPTYVMDMDLNSLEFPTGDCVITSRADDNWLNAYFRFSNYTDNVKIETAKQILNNVRSTMICGRILKQGVSVACGSAVIERGYMALLNIVVDEPQRGKGYGREICESLLAASKNLGAHTAYLQVVQDNQKAINLYTKLGYKTLYSYWYRVKRG